MKRLALTLILAGSLTAPAVAATPPRTVNLLQTFGGRLTHVKQVTTLPILLPRTMPLGGTYRLYASGNATRHSYALSLAAAPNCRGANACFVAQFDGERSGKLPGKPNVKLAAGDPALYHPVGCGASCSPASFWFTHAGVLYSTQVKDLPKGDRAILIRMANQAIGAGPR
jgi:hypothetical protein